MELQRYDPAAAQLAQFDPNVQAMIRQLEAQGQQPIIVVAPSSTAARQEPRVVAAQPLRENAHNQHGLVFITIAAILFVAVFSIGVVSCHETPIIHETRINPNCHNACF